jgi:2-keto-4-pentenoate hydratase/2-oxohepta-3-ene-1,7-dioic acid hydratase in catechol pathway
MRLATYQTEGRASWGLVEGNVIADVGTVLGDRYADLKAVIAADALGSVPEAARTAQRHSVSAITWLPVIPNPDKILCVGLNYEMHRQETGRAEVQNPTIFGRWANSQIGHLADIIRPRISTDLDFEGELALVIGKPGRYISKDDAWGHIAGYAIYNEGSVRDFQRHTHQFTPGKNFPGTGAFGPWLMTPDELGDLPNLRLQTRVNGQIVQDALLGQMIFDIPTQIAYCSSFTRLEQ